MSRKPIRAENRIAGRNLPWVEHRKSTLVEERASAKAVKQERAWDIMSKGMSIGHSEGKAIMEDRGLRGYKGSGEEFECNSSAMGRKLLAHFKWRNVE